MCFVSIFHSRVVLEQIQMSCPQEAHKCNLNKISLYLKSPNLLQIHLRPNLR